MLGSLLACSAVDLRSEETIEAAAQPVRSRSLRDAERLQAAAPQVVAVAGDAFRPD